MCQHFLTLSHSNNATYTARMAHILIYNERTNKVMAMTRVEKTAYYRTLILGLVTIALQALLMAVFI